MLYRVSMPDPHSHLFHVELTVDAPTSPTVLVFPIWAPGSYLVREFARNVEGFRVEDGAGRSVELERIDKHRFQIRAPGAGRLLIRYRMYANELTVRTCHLDGSHGYINGPALFPYVDGRRDEKCVLEIAPPSGWRVATALPGGPTEFGARDYDELVDSPVEIGTHSLLSFTALGKPHAVALYGRGDVDTAALQADLQRIVETLGHFMGGLPYDRYLFIFHLTERRRGGLEHAQSATLNVQRSSFARPEEYEKALALVAHELFHVWNVKRLRPAAFTPYDYTREQYTRLLWWFEGATRYYDGLMLLRAGLSEPRRYLRRLGEQLTILEGSPGARKTSLEEASLTTWIKYYRPDENSANSSISYYVAGEVAVLALDLALRRSGSSLDRLMRRLWEEYAEAGLPEDGVERVVAELMGEEQARGFFRRHVRGTEPIELDSYLDLVGLRLRRRVAQGFDDRGGTPPRLGEGMMDTGWLGVEFQSGSKLVVAAVREGSPAHRAGLYAGDEIVAEDRFRIDRAGLWDRLCERGAGGKLRLAVFRRDELLDLDVPLGPQPEDVVWLEPELEPSAQQKTAFEAWTGTSWPDG